MLFATAIWFRSLLLLSIIALGACITYNICAWLNKEEEKGDDEEEEEEEEEEDIKVLNCGGRGDRKGGIGRDGFDYIVVHIV